MSEKQEALFVRHHQVDLIPVTIFRHSNAGKWHLRHGDKSLCGKLKYVGDDGNYEQRASKPASFVTCYYFKKAALVEAISVTIRCGFNTDFESMCACYDMLVDLGQASLCGPLLVAISQIR